MHRESTIKRWTSIVDELMESGKSVEEFARERKISSGTLYKWRRSILGPVRAPSSPFVPVLLRDSSADALVVRPNAYDAKITVTQTTDLELLRAVLQALA